MSPVASQRLSRPFNVKLDSSLLLGNTQLREVLGVPSDVLLKTVIATDPPPLPAPHLSRSSVFSDLAETLDFHRVAAVIGYPESGKTVAIAEFAAAYPGDVFWFSIAHSETHPNAWLGLLCFALAQHVDAESILPNEVRFGLVDRQYSRPLLLVIDNAQHCHDLDALSFLVEAAEATPALSLLLVGTDEPAFVSAVRRRGIVDWRLPGLTEHEARALVELTGDTLLRHQSLALEFLRIRVHGHLGMLKLSRQAIRRIETVEQQEAFSSQMSSALGAGLDSLQSAMIERLRDGLHYDEVDLCRHLSIVVGSFPRRVGEHVWALDRPRGDFHRPWNGCVVGVFESQPSGRFSLPDLYRDGFRQEADKEAVKLWHGAIADGFQEREGDFVDVFDIHAAVFHRLLSGNVTAALESASMYLACASGPHARTAQAFLIRPFEMWLASSARNPTLPATQRIRWHAVRARVYAELGYEDRADVAVHELHDVLRTDPSDAAPEAILFGWTIVLINASRAGQPELALSAVSRIDNPSLSVFGGPPVPWREFLVVCAYLNSSKSPLAYLRTVMGDRGSESQNVSLWSTMTGYEFWRAVNATIYSRGRDWEVERGLAAQLVGEVSTFAGDCRAAGEFEVACLSACLLVNLHIDLLRDFEGACDISQATSGLVDDTMDARVSAYVYDTRGDAFRCAGKDDLAVSSYLVALRRWPDSEIHDRAETHLMLGISYAKLGKFRDGTKSARAADELYARPNHDVLFATSDLAAARCLLEAAAFSIHGNDYSMSGRCLIAAHNLLRNTYCGTSEWVALGQIAWALTNRLKPDPVNPQAPVPGFTLGLDDKINGAEKMLRSAPTTMLALACAAVGRPHRALCYFEAVLAECDASEMQMQVGIMALDAAIDAQDLAAAARYAALGSDWLAHAPPTSPQGDEAFVFDFLIGRTIQLASLHQDDQHALAEIDRAISVLAKLPARNPATELLADTLAAYREARLNGDDAALEKVFQLALAHKALWAARDIAWYWCFRFSPGRPAYERQYFLWHWRLCWLSVEIGSSDAAYLAGVLQQELAYWNQLPRECRSEDASHVLGRLDTTDQSPKMAIQSLIAELATVACRSFNVSDVSREVAAELRLAKDASCLANALDALYIRLLDLLLHPGAPHVLSSLQEELASVLGGLGSSTTVVREVQDQFKGLAALARVLEVGQPSERAFEALRIACPRAAELSSNSAAQLYTWLRHFVTCSPDDFGFEPISRMLTCAHIAELLRDNDLLPYVRIRLVTCHLTAKAFIAQRRLGGALAAIETQKRMRSPIAVSAISSAKATRDSALQELEAIVKEFQGVVAETSDFNLKNERWSCCHELGGVRLLAGSMLLKQGHDASAKDRWLRPSSGDFRMAVEAAKPLDSPERIGLALKAAFAGQSVARALDDTIALAEFNDLINEIRSMGGYDEVIAAEALLESTNILNLPDGPRDGRGPLKPDDHDAIQVFTNHLMQSTGWPEDRQRYVEDDVRKIARIEQQQDEYCQHLQPLQNLLHTRSPHTVYASPTMYTCSCTLLNHETRIEMEDIETVLDAMKRVYCENCNHRSPGLGE